MTREMIMNELRNRGYEVAINDVVKNGVLFEGIAVGNGTLRPTIYVDSYLDRDDLDVVVDEIENIYDKSLIESLVIDTNKLMDWDYVKTQLQLCIQKKGNENIVKRDFLDLEQYVRVIVDSDNKGTASFKVKPEHLEKFGIDENTLFNAAWDCTKPTLTSMDLLEIMAEMMGTDIEELKSEAPMDMTQLVLSNKDKVHGAVAMCDTELLSKIADKYEADLAILPSSIHECIVMPVDIATSFTKLNKMVQEVNENEVAPEEVLSDHAYRFNHDTREVVY